MRTLRKGLGKKTTADIRNSKGPGDPILPGDTTGRKHLVTEWPYQKDVIRFYGNPIGSHGRVSEVWKSENLVLVDLPYPMVLAWDEHEPITKCWFHWKCAKAFISCLKEIKQAYTPAERAKHGLTKYGGSFTYRLMSGGSHLSMHAYGCALDIDPEHNAFGSKHWTIPKEVVDIFERAGFVWGGRWRKPDAMHFQAARV